MSNTVVGFSTSTKKAANRHQWKLYDEELIQQDLLNLFNTRVGARIGRPTFGCRIWDYWMEQRTQSIVSMIKDEVQRVCEFDPRVLYLSSTLTEVDHGITITVDLKNNLTKGSMNLVLNFDERQGLATKG